MGCLRVSNNYDPPVFDSSEFLDVNRGQIDRGENDPPVIFLVVWNWLPSYYRLPFHVIKFDRWGAGRRSCRIGLQGISDSFQIVKEEYKAEKNTNEHCEAPHGNGRTHSHFWSDSRPPSQYHGIWEDSTAHAEAQSRTQSLGILAFTRYKNNNNNNNFYLNTISI